MNNIIELKVANDVFENSFVIPNYQRGYRWEKEHVENLLNDFKEFYNDIYKKDRETKEIYCLQPLIVQRKNNNSKDQLEVVDGQQRLTTLYIIKKIIQKKSKKTLAFNCSLEYATRPNSKDFIEKICENEDQDKYKKCSDFYFMEKAKKVAEKWFENNKNDIDDIDDFNKMIDQKVNFIWYELGENEDPIEVFTRLNIGKISLTESELIKALFLSKNNFKEQINEDEIFKSLFEIANDWEKIEYKLQDDRFWLFFHENNYEKPTRIDFILDLIRKRDDKTKIEDCYFPTFSYFYKLLNTKEEKLTAINDNWNKVKNIFQVLTEWYNDKKYYHYIGFLCYFRGNEFINTLIKEYRKDDKNQFIEYLKGEIKDCCKDCNDLNKIYDDENNGNIPKSKTKPLLLLHNIQTIVDQNDHLENDDIYELPDFIRFPFHLFKKENWEVEHIRPNNSNNFRNQRKDSEIKKFLYINKNSNNKAINDAIKEYEENIKKENADEDKCFNDLWEKINNDENELNGNQKNLIWNYVLLDSTTNEEYGNSCFQIKRDFIINKINGKKPKFNISGNQIELVLVDEVAFVPIVTKNVFSKFYTQFPSDLSFWTEKDAAFYRMDIEQRLWWVLEPSKGLKENEFKDKFAKYKKEVIDKNFNLTFKQFCEKKRDGSNE